MQRLIQIIYISRSTFHPAESFRGIEPNVARILAKSRANNRNLGLGGVLYFGDGCFFQCLEGEESAVDALYLKLQADPRHKDLKLIARKRIREMSFSDWAMKYVPLDHQMNHLLKVHGYQTFDPYAFKDEMTEAVLRLLHAATDPSASAVATQDNANKSDGNDAVGPHHNFAKLAVGLSALSLVLSLSALIVAFKY